MNAPERIWAKAQEWPAGTGRIEVYAAAKDDPDDPATEYIRADLHAAALDREARLVEALEKISAEYSTKWQAGQWSRAALAGTKTEGRG